MTRDGLMRRSNRNLNIPPSPGKPRPGGGTSGISGWGCAATTLEPLAYTRASFSWILLPYTRVNSPNGFLGRQNLQSTGQFREK